MRLRSLLTILAFTMLTTAANAAVFIQTDINLGPGEVEESYVPPPRPGYVWSPGYWAWDGYNRYWVEGYWIEERPGYVWVPDRWDHFDNGWRFYKGHYYDRRYYHPRPAIVNRPVVINHYDRPPARPVAVQHRDAAIEHHDDHHDDHRGPGVSSFQHDGRSNGHGPYER